MRTFSIVVVMFLLSVGVVPAHAQVSHVAPQSILDAAVQDHVAASETDRETVQRLLERPEVQAVAGDIGLDLRRAQSAISTLDDAEQLSAIAAQASQVEQALAGGQSSITISTTLIIIGLLVLILIVLIA